MEARPVGGLIATMLAIITGKTALEKYDFAMCPSRLDMARAGLEFFQVVLDG